MANLNEVMLDNYGKFIQSDLWKIIKYRIGHVYLARLNEALYTAASKQETNEAVKYAGMMQAVLEVIRITEHMGGELEKDTLAADAALHVIENIARDKQTGGNKWIQNILNLSRTKLLKK